MSEITVAASESAVKDLFGVVRDNFTWAAAETVDFGPFSAWYDVALHLEDGNVDLRSDGTVAIEELDVKWDHLGVGIGVDLPGHCFGGWCILPTPFGCALRVPRICVFDKNPDIKIPLELGGLVTSEVSIAANPETHYFVDPSRPPGMTPIQAENAGIPNKWQIFLHPTTVDVDPIDVADTVGDLFENAVNAAVDAILPGPSWLRDAVRTILGPVIDLIRTLLDIPDDIGEWLAHLLNTSLGLLNQITTAILDYFAAQNALFEFEDPYPILPATGSLIPVKIPVIDFDVRVTDDEMVVEADVGP
jgi:hypothetical protein